MKQSSVRKNSIRIRPRYIATSLTTRARESYSRDLQSYRGFASGKSPADKKPQGLASAEPSFLSTSQIRVGGFHPSYNTPPWDLYLATEA